jgi:lipopolysaccharide/colanic/teichoic acid biosynthesis glycosyltransferase
MSDFDHFAKRAFDFVVACSALVLLSGLIIGVLVIAYIDTKRNPLFRQTRIGRYGRHFVMYKVRTMRDVPGITTTITTQNDPRITRVGKWLRRLKLDELPQLVNVVRGDMSLVGPRPEVPKYLEFIRMQAPIVLSARPGVTGPATLKYRCEEKLLASQPDPEWFNDSYVLPDKLRINERYIREYRFMHDLKCLWQTCIPGRFEKSCAPLIQFHDTEQDAA